MELSSLSLQELRSLEIQIRKEIESKKTQELERARDEIRAIAERTGLPLEELISSSLKFKQRKPSVPVKYRHPDSGDSWSGRGRQPKFVKDWVESGKPLSDLEVSQ